MKVKFLQDFRGRETHEVFYRAGDIADIDPHNLGERGICEPIPEEPKTETRAAVPPTEKDENEKNLDQVHNRSRRKRNG